jgi:serine/threonine-protein kinase
MSRSYRLGKYHLVAEIARGGMGVVYLAVAMGPAGFNKLLILKVLQTELAEDPTFLEMFFEEARLAARLSHPNIVQTYEVGSEGKRHFIVMDYLNGRSLSRVLRRKKLERFTVAMHLRVICEALRGLDYAHNLTDFDGKRVGIIHRDVNPQNVFITFDGQVKLVDFGIAKALDSKLETRTGMLKGKPGYMAPEQLGGEVDARSDVFAAGVMIWEAVAGRRLWGQKTDLEILSQLMHGRLPALAEELPDAPAELIEICNKAMARDPEDRYQTAAELYADLDGYLADHHPNVSARDAAIAVSEMFAEEAANTRAAIESCLARVRAGEEPQSLSAMPPLLHEATPSHRTPDVEPLPPSTHTPSTPNGTEAPMTPAERSPTRRQWPLLAVLAACGGLVVFGLLIALPTSPGDAPTAAPEAAVAPASPAPPAPTPISPASAEPPPPAPEPAADVPSAAVPAKSSKPVAPAAARPVSRPRVAPAQPAATAPRSDPAPASSCNPPFYYDGKKKVYKPGCI